MNKIIIAILSLIWGILFVNGMLAYSESKVLYLIFSFVFLIFLISAIYKIISYSYLFLTIILWLGIWLKLTLHLIFDYAYIEPIGSFYSLNAKMDDVLVVAIVGVLGVLLTNVLYKLRKIRSTIKILKESGKHPFFYKSYRKYRIYIFNAILSIAIILSIFNIIFNIQLSGMVPTTILIYPLNALTYWLLGMGIPLFIVIMISWDIRFNKELLMKYLVFYVIVMAITSIGILSRGQYIFMVGSVLVFLLIHYKEYNNIHYMNIILFVLFTGSIYLFVVNSVTDLRSYYFSGASFSGASFSGASFSGASFSGASFSGAYNLILRLAVDRWIGLEGLMAVVSYPDKGTGLFVDALTRKAEIGNIDIYQYISNAHYKDMNNMKFSFATIPGVMAFLFYTGSFLFVFIGMFIISSLMVAIEYIVYNWLKCSLIAAIIGIYLANVVARFGLMPINLLKSLFFLFSFLTLIKFIKSNYFENIYLRYFNENNN